jgi:hypothetical protein
MTGAIEEVEDVVNSEENILAVTAPATPFILDLFVGMNPVADIVIGSLGCTLAIMYMLFAVLYNDPVHTPHGFIKGTLVGGLLFGGAVATAIVSLTFVV